MKKTKASLQASPSPDPHALHTLISSLRSLVSPPLPPLQTPATQAMQTLQVNANLLHLWVQFF